MNVYELYFSPTGGTKKAADLLTDALAPKAAQVNLTDSKTAFSDLALTAEDLAVIAVPSYAGRVPAVAVQRLAAVKGNGARAVLVCVYGNRAYEDTLVELAESYELNKNPLHPYTKTLLSAVPVPDPEVSRQRQRIVLEGDIPSPMNPPRGCRFHTRCPYATERCSQEMPQLTDVGGKRKVACLRYQEINS